MKRPLLTFLLTVAATTAAAAPPTMEVFKSPYCGCCGKWVAHLQKAGFAVKVIETGDMPAQRKALGMPDRYGSCHTARIAGYLIEGHVPAADIKTLLTRRTKALGLAVPGMPAGSPGMEGARPQAYDSLLIDNSGNSTVFASHP